MPLPSDPLFVLTVLACMAGAPASVPEVIARLEDRAVAESSGVAASRRHPGIYWTHNDSGNAPVLYAFDRQGRNRGRWTVRGARNVDWEDIAIGPGPVRGRWYLYIADTGDNGRARSEIVVYRVPEPDKLEACRGVCVTAPAAAMRLRYPDEPHDAETLLVHPVSGDLYIVTKAGGPDPHTIVFAARARRLGEGPIVLSEIAALPLPDPLFARLAGGITGGDISPDGLRVALSDYFHVYEAVLPAGAPFDRIWEIKFRQTTLGFSQQVEGVCYRADGKALLATAEGSPCPLMEIVLDE